MKTTALRRNRNDHENCAHQQRHNYPDDVHLEQVTAVTHLAAAGAG
jgi:hypothetical protein